MAIERERGISVSAAVMSFERGVRLQPARHGRATQDFSPKGVNGDTYRILTAVPQSLPPLAGRVREGAIGRRPNGAKAALKEQTRKLFEVCRLRDVPIITFVNKLNREIGRPVRPLGRDRADPRST